MALHMNDSGLRSIGFKPVALYDFFVKEDWDKSRCKYNWRHYQVKCYTNEAKAQYLIRYIGRRGNTWDNVYDSREEANDKMKWYFENTTFHKTLKF